ncbi:MAG: replication initiation protein [Chitinophagales bacterium]|nr:replication initiation protein [Chitinophagales bacterium]
MNTATQISTFPKVPQDLSSIVKPEELVDIVEMTPLTLQDRRIYNLLIGHAWNNITSRARHIISRQELTKYVDSNNQDIKASLRRLMSAIVIIKIRNNKNRNPSTRQIQLLGTNETEDHCGSIEYSFPEDFVKIIRNTQIFARLHTKVMFELSSKYSLALYEFLQKRKNLQYINNEVITLEEARAFLGVDKNKLKSFGHFNNKALKPAVREVSFLTEYEITAEPIRSGRAVSHVKFSWQKKTDIGSQIAAVEELERSKLGREARIKRETETITSSQKGDSLNHAKHISDLLPGFEEQSKRLLRQLGSLFSLLVNAWMCMLWRRIF